MIIIHSYLPSSLESSRYAKLAGVLGVGKVGGSSAISSLNDPLGETVECSLNSSGGELTKSSPDPGEEVGVGGSLLPESQLDQSSTRDWSKTTYLIR